ncbi:MAG: 1-acyl-sn-glycerol-3-phosphate acyltransferase [Actinomycetota bacterium]
MPRERPAARILQGWARTALRVLLRRVDVTGLERIPVERPVILAANHTNAMADVAVIVAFAPRFPRFLATATWLRYAPVRALFRFASVLPVHRRRDGDPARNEQMFAECSTALAAGDHLAVFPEGEMHDGPALLPLRTGVARIALGAAVHAGVRGTVVVPVGLVYDSDGLFANVAELHVGEPIEVDDWVERARVDEATAVRGLTAELGERLATVTVNDPSERIAALIDRAAGLALADDADHPDDVALARRSVLRRALGRAVERDGGETGATFGALASEVAGHGAALADLGLDPARAVPVLAPPPVVDRVRRRVRVAGGAPVAALGAVANAPTLALRSGAQRRVRRPGWRLTVLGVGATVVSPVVWAVERSVLARRIGRARATAVVAAGALAAPVAVSWGHDLARLRAYQWFDRTDAARPDAVRAARATRAAVRTRVAAIVGTRSRAGLVEIDRP